VKKWPRVSRIVIESAPKVRRLPECVLPVRGVELIDPATGNVTVKPLRWEAD
jgi:hypothetical protein